MDTKQLYALSLRDTDVEGALRRMGGSEELYATCLRMFLTDSTVEEINAAIRAQSWDEAFTAAHALKGLAGNMGFIPLMHATGQLVITIRGGRITEVQEYLALVNSRYRDIIDAIRDCFPAEDTKGE